MGQPIKATENCFTVDKFEEKPNLESAKDYIRSGDYLWNSSLFLFKADSYLEELSNFQPQIFDACRAALNNAKPDLDFIRLDEESFLRAPSISIDYAVMERTRRACVIPVEPDWNDAGSWTALWRF